MFQRLSRATVFALVAALGLGVMAAPATAVAATETTTVVEASQASVTVLDTVDFTATVSPAPTGGTVAWSVDGSPVATTNVSADGVAGWSSKFALGRHAVVAAFVPADDTVNASTSDPVQIVASLVPTTTTVTALPNPGKTGHSVVFTATVAGSPTPNAGNVAWTVDGVGAGTVALGSDGTASLTKTWADPGTHAVKASFTEGATWDASSDTLSLTVDLVPYTVAATPARPIVASGDSTTIHVSVAGATSGNVRVSGVNTPLRTDGTADISTGRLTVDRTFDIEFYPVGATTPAGGASVTITVRPYGVTLINMTATPSAAVDGETLVQFSVAGDAEGSVLFTDTLNGSTKMLAAVDLTYDPVQWYLATLSVRLTGVGTHTVTASYVPNDEYAPSGADPAVQVVVSADTGVAATGVGVSYTTFYPYKDNYRDTVSIRGTLLETASVSVSIYASSGHRVRLFSLTARTGAYSIAWNGRSSSGTLQAAGRYKVVQTIKDRLGHTKAFTAYTTLSKKRLYWYTATITKYGNQVYNYDESDYGWVEASNRYYRGVDIYGNIYDQWAWVGYAFSLKSATAYSTMTFKVLGTPWSGRGVPYISVWNYANGEEDGVRWVGRSYAWYGTSVSPTAHRNAHTVHAFVTVMGSNEGWYDIAKVALTYKYALLK